MGPSQFNSTPTTWSCRNEGQITPCSWEREGRQFLGISCGRKLEKREGRGTACSLNLDGEEGWETPCSSELVLREWWGCKGLERAGCWSPWSWRLEEEGCETHFCFGHEGRDGWGIFWAAGLCWRPPPNTLTLVTLVFTTWSILKQQKFLMPQILRSEELNHITKHFENCKIFLLKILLYLFLINWDVIFQVSSQFKLMFLTIWAFEFCHNLSLSCHNLSRHIWDLMLSQFWDLSQFELSHFEFVSFVTIWVVTIQVFFYSFFFTISGFEFNHNLSIWVLSQLNFITWGLPCLVFGMFWQMQCLKGNWFKEVGTFKLQKLCNCKLRGKDHIQMQIICKGMTMGAQNTQENSSQIHFLVRWMKLKHLTVHKKSHRFETTLLALYYPWSWTMTRGPS